MNEAGDASDVKTARQKPLSTSSASTSLVSDSITPAELNRGIAAVFAAAARLGVYPGQASDSHLGSSAIGTDGAVREQQLDETGMLQSFA